MADILWRVFELFVNLLESCIVIHFICSFLNLDFKSKRGKLIYISGVALDFISVTVINNFIVYESFGGIIYVLIYLLYEILFFNGSIFKKLFSALIAVIVLASISLGMSGIVSTIFNSSVATVYEPHTIERICTVISIQILLFCVYDLIIKFSVTTLRKIEWKLVLSILGTSFVSLACMHITLVYENYYVKLIMVAEFGIIILNIVCFYMTYSLSKSNAEAEELRMKRQQEEYRISYAENIKNQYEEIRRMRHDMKQNLAVISELYRKQKYDEASRFADRVSDNLSKFDNVIDVQNDFINAILNSKLITASEYGIRIICSSSNNISGIDYIDLCNLLGNMLDNAIEAAKACEKGYIEVSINSDENKLLVIIANSIAQSVLKSNKDLTSTKRDSERHGYGIKTIRSIAHKYDGFAKFYEENNMFYCQVLMYKPDNAKLT